MKTRKNPFIPSALAISLMACGLVLPSVGSAAYAKPHKVVKAVSRAPLVRQSVFAPQLLVQLRGNVRLTQTLMLTLDRLAGTPLHVTKAVGANEYQMFTAKPVSLQVLQGIAARLKTSSNVLSAGVLESSPAQYLIGQSAHPIVLKGNGLIRSSVPIIRYRWKQIAGPRLRINDASAPNLATTPSTSTTTTPPVADPTSINPGELFSGMFPTNIQPCSAQSSTGTSTPADASNTGTPSSGSTPSPVGRTFAFSGTFSSSYANQNPDGSVKTGTFATSFSGAWSTDKNGFLCSLNQDPNAGTPATSTPPGTGGNTSTTPVDSTTGTTPGTSATPGTTDTSGGTAPGTTNTSGSTTDTSGNTGLANPVSGTPASVGTPLATDPATGQYIDPTTGQDMTTDPTTGLPLNPTTGQPVDPTTGLPVSSATTGSTTGSAPTSSTAPVTASSVRATQAFIQKHHILGFRLLATDRAGIVHARNVYIHVKPASVRPAVKRPLKAKPVAKGRTLNPIKTIRKVPVKKLSVKR